MSSKLADLLKVPHEGLNNSKILFVSSYENNYDDSGTKLYQSIVYNQGTFQENIGQAVMRKTKNDRAETEEFLRGVLRLIMEAIDIEQTYLRAKGFKVNADHNSRQWVEKIKILTQKLKEIDDSVRNAFYHQCLTDTEAIVVENAKLSNKDLSNLLYKELTRKYYWRDWMVLVYNPISGWDNHGIRTCGGGHFFRLHGHNVVIASVDKSEPAFDLARARQTLLEVYEGRQRDYYFDYRLPEFESVNADKILDSMDTSFACSIAIIRRTKNPGIFNYDPSNLYVNFPETRGVFVPRYVYNMIMFGSAHSNLMEFINNSPFSLFLRRLANL